MKVSRATLFCTLIVSSTTPGCGDSCPEPLDLTGFGTCSCPGNQQLDPANESCGCPENSILDGVTCICAEGFTEDDAGLCQPDGAGQSCSIDADCLDPSYPLCFGAGRADGYCTLPDCLEAPDCPPNWQCLEDGTARLVCQRPPSGLNLVCDINADCAGLEASFCDPLNKICRVPDCAFESGSCFGDLICCDVRGAPFPSPDTVCVTPDEAESVIAFGATCAP